VKDYLGRLGTGRFMPHPRLFWHARGLRFVLTMKPLRGVACALLALVHVGCQAAADPAPRTTVRIVDSSILTQALVDEYRQRLPQFDFEVVPLGRNALATLTSGDGDIAIVLADSAYFAYASGQGPRGLSGLSVAPELTMQLVVQPERGIRSITNIRGRSVVPCAGCPPGRVDQPASVNTSQGEFSPPMASTRPR
jgi:hypothetical protein